MAEVVRIEQDRDGIAVLTLNRPQALNAVSIALAEALAAALEECATDDATRAVVVTGAGDRAFSAGVDLREASTMEVARIEEWFGTVCRTYTGILAVNKPVVAALNGLAAGAGFQIALVCDLRVGHPGIRMGQPEINAGLPSVMGSYWMTLHLPWSKNQELSYTGRFMDCDRVRTPRTPRGRGGGGTGPRSGERARKRARGQGAGRLPPHEGALSRARHARIRGGIPGRAPWGSRRPMRTGRPRPSWPTSSAAGADRLPGGNACRRRIGGRDHARNSLEPMAPLGHHGGRVRARGARRARRPEACSGSG